MTEFSDSVFSRLRQAGIEGAELVGTPMESKSAATPVFRVGPLLLHFERDRSLDAVSIGSIAVPNWFYQFCDVEVAMGWKTPDEIVGGKIERLDQVLAQLTGHINDLNAVFSQESDSPRAPNSSALRRSAWKHLADDSSVRNRSHLLAIVG
jgi:hypothetical protein